MPKRLTTRGLSLLEIVIYVAILGLMLVLVFDTVIAITRATRVVRTEKLIVSGATLSLERMTREIRDTETVMTESSTFDTNPGVLVVSATDPDGVTTETRFDRTSGGALRLTRGGASELLTPRDLYLENLVFRHSTTTQGEAVKIELTFTATSTATTSAKFYSTVVLRGGYE